MTRPTSRLALLAAALLALGACDQPPRPLAADTAEDPATDLSAGGARQAIEAANQATSEAIARGDAQAVMGHYAEDAMILPAGAAAVSGHAAIRGYFERAIAAGVNGLTLDIVSVETSGELAVETGTYEARDAAGGRIDAGKYVVTWRRSGEQWLAYRDISTTSLPLSAPQAAALPAACSSEGTGAAPPAES